MIPRYTRAEMGAIWTDQGKFQRWLEVEIAATDTLAERGIVPKEAAALIRERSRVDAARVNEIEARVRHDVIAFTLAVGETIGDPGGGALAALRPDLERRGGHRAGPADCAKPRESSSADLARSAKCWQARAREFQHTPQIGRTHGVHAEPITFGLKMANWFAENQRNIERFGAAAQQMARGENFRRGGQRLASRRGSRGSDLQAAGTGRRRRWLRR